MIQSYFSGFAPRRTGRSWLPVAILFSLLLSPLVGWGQVTLVSWNYDDSNVTADGGIAANTAQVTSATGGQTITYTAGAGGSGFAITGTNWAGGSGTKYWQIDLVTTGYNTLKVSSKQRSSNTGPRNFKVEYRVGAGAWADVPGASVLVANDAFLTGVLTNVAIPVAADNQSAVSLRWIMTSNSDVGTGIPVVNGGTSRIDDIVVTGTAAGLTLATSAVTGSPFCVLPSGAAVTVPFTVTGGSFTAGNTFRAFISNDNFVANKTAISATQAGTTSGSISATIPNTVTAGTNYRIRVEATNPAQNGSDNGTNLTVTNPTANVPTVSPSTAQTLTSALGTTITATPAAPSTYQWFWGPAGGPFTNAISGATSASYQPAGADFNGGTAGTYGLVVTATSTCGSVAGTSTPAVSITTRPTFAIATNANGSTRNFGSVGLGNTAVQTFTIQNNGSATLTFTTPLTLTGSSDYAVTAQPAVASLAVGASTTFQVTISPTATGTITGSVAIASNDPNTPTYTVNFTGTGTPSATSVVENNAFTINTTGINYAAFQAAPVASTTDGVLVYSIRVRDGDGVTPDGDALPTILNSITFSSVAGTASIRSAALFTSSNALVSNTATIGASTITFNGLVALLTPGGNVSRVTAADGGSFNLFLRVSFNNTPATITDGQQLQFSVTGAGAVASTSGSSTFNTSFATVQSPTGTNDNRVNAIATKLVFSPVPPTTALVSNNFSVTVIAQDANNVADTDFRGSSMPSVTLTIAGGTGTLSSATGLTQMLVSGTYTWTDVQYSVAEAGLTLSTTNTGSLTNPTAPIAFDTFVGKRWDGGAGTTNWYDANNWSPNGVPTASTAVLLDNSSVLTSYTVNINVFGAVCQSMQVGYAGNTTAITLNLNGDLNGTQMLLVGNGAAGNTDLLIADGGRINNNDYGAAAPGGSTLSEGLRFASSTLDTWEMTGTGYFYQETRAGYPNSQAGTVMLAATTTFEMVGFSATGAPVQSWLPRVKSYGNLRIISPQGTANLVTTSSTFVSGDSLLVRGDLTVTDGTFSLNNSSSKGVRLRVLGNMVVDNATFRVVDGASNTSAFNRASIVGNLTMINSGIFRATGSGDNLGKLYIGGSLTGQYSAGANTTTGFDELVFLGGSAASTFTPSGGTIRNVSIRKEVILGASYAYSTRTEVQSGGTLDFNNFNVTGAGQFFLRTGGTLKITDIAGITQAAASATGNVRSTGARSFFNDGATYWYTGPADQNTGTGLPTANGTKNVIINNSTTVTLTNGISIQAPGALDIRSGRFIETATAEVVGTGNLTMTGGTYRIVKTGATLLPQLSGTYALTAGTVELQGAGNQVLKGSQSYASLAFRDSGTKTLSSSITGANQVSGTVFVREAAVLDLSVGARSLDGPAGLTMDGTSRFINANSGTQPGLEGAYSLTGGTIEFNGSNVGVGTTQTIRGNQTSPVINRTYFNIDVTGTNVGASNANFAVGTGGTMTVKTGASFVMTDQTISGAGSFITETGSTFGYGAVAGINTTGATGNIQTGTRTFNAAATYLLRGVNDMATGTALPASVLNLTANLSATRTATLTNATTVTGALTLTQGHIGLVNNDLTLDPTTGSLVGGSAASYVQTANSPTATGELVRRVANTNTDVLFPVGTTTYTPVLVKQALTATADDFRARVFGGARDGGLTGTAETTDVVNRTWMVDETTAGNANATITLQWNTADELLPSFDRTKCTVVHYEGTEWTNVLRDYTAATTVSAGVFRRSRANITSFSPFAVQDYEQVLPVELTRFTATVSPKRTVALAWATASELNADRFEVQRSANGREFTTIGTVGAQGTTTTAHDYSFEDARPLGGTSFYRLRQVDTDGTAQFSGVATIRLDATVVTASFEAYPTQFRDLLHLTIGAPVAGDARLTVTDLAGREVLATALPVVSGATATTLPSADRLAPGQYVVRVALPGGATLRTRVVKE